MEKLTDNKVIVISGSDYQECLEVSKQLANDNIKIINPNALLGKTLNALKLAYDSENERGSILLGLTQIYNDLFNIPYIICSKNLFNSCVTNSVFQTENPKYQLYLNINKFIRNWQRRLVKCAIEEYPNKTLIIVFPYSYDEIENISSNMLYVWVNNERDGERLKINKRAEDCKFKESLNIFKLNAQYVFNNSIELLNKKVVDFINGY